MPILSVGLSYKLNAVPNTDVGVLWCVGGPGPGTGPTCMDMHGSPLVYIYIHLSLCIYIYSAIVPAFAPLIKDGSGGKNTILGASSADVEAALSNTDCLHAI